MKPCKIFHEERFFFMKTFTGTLKDVIIVMNVLFFKKNFFTPNHFEPSEVHL